MCVAEGRGKERIKGRKTSRQGRGRGGEGERRLGRDVYSGRQQVTNVCVCYQYFLFPNGRRMEWSDYFLLPCVCNCLPDISCPYSLLMFFPCISFLLMDNFSGGFDWQIVLSGSSCFCFSYKFSGVI